MRAYRSLGPVVTIDASDREALQRGETLECKVNARREIFLSFSIRPEVESETLEERGFHMVCTPDSGYDTAKRYDIVVTPALFERIMDEQCFITRGPADRTTINYYDPAVPYKFPN